MSEDWEESYHPIKRHQVPPAPALRPPVTPAPEDHAPVPVRSAPAYRPPVR